MTSSRTRGTDTYPPQPRTGADGGARDDAPGAHFRPVDPELYLRKEPLAAGGMGRTFTAVDQRLGRRVVLKELPDPQEDLPPGIRDRLRLRLEQEARILASLQHPNIVTVHEAGVWTDGEPFYAMSFVRGRDVARAVDEMTGLEQRLGLLPSLIAVSEAVAYAHGQGIIHRDLTPRNILVGDYGDAVIIDWGIAKVLGTDADMDLSLPGLAPVSDGMTAAGMGSPAYASPEQLRGKEPDERFDVYTLGATLHFVLSGAPPFSGETIRELVVRVHRGQREPLPQGIPRELVAIVDKAMHLDAEERYRSARELADELRAFQAGRLVAAHRYSPWERGRMWLRRRWRTVLIVTAAAVALGAVLGLRHYRSQSRQAVAQSAAASKKARLAETARKQSEQLRASAEEAARRAASAAENASRTAEESRKQADALTRSLAETRKQRSWALRTRKQALQQARREAELKAAADKARQAAEAAATKAQQARQRATSLADQARSAEKQAQALAAAARQAAGAAEGRARKAEQALAAAQQQLAAARQQTAARDRELRQVRGRLEAAREQLRQAEARLATAGETAEKQRRQLDTLRAEIEQTRKALEACRRPTRPGAGEEPTPPE